MGRSEILPTTVPAAACVLQGNSLQVPPPVRVCTTLHIVHASLSLVTMNIDRVSQGPLRRCHPLHWAQVKSATSTEILCRTLCAIPVRETKTRVAQVLALKTTFTSCSASCNIAGRHTQTNTPRHKKYQ